MEVSTAPVASAVMEPVHTAGTTPDGRTKLAWREALQTLHRSVEFAQAAVLSTVPRGGVQVIAPDHADETIVRALSRNADHLDRLTWHVLVGGKPAVASEVWGDGLAGSAFDEAVLQPTGLRDHLAVPLASPLLPGYAGVFTLFREAGGKAFKREELKRVAEFVAQQQPVIERHAVTPPPMPHMLPAPLMVFGPNGQLLYPTQHAKQLAEQSDRLRLQVEQAVAKTLEKRDSDAAGKRVALPDDRGDLWIFRIRRVESHPALAAAAGLASDGPMVFVTHLPQVADYAAVRAADVAADDELSRLVPALKFMYDEHRNGPTLDAIAKHVHLSPFHFHRRFTELLGLTPKHYLFDCQIDTAKRLLVAGTELADIAKHCGFAHQSHFTSRFKQATGLTPTRWRKLANSGQ